MKPAIEKILPILQQLIGLHRQLHETCRTERDALISADVKQIQELTHAKELIIERIRQEESKRLRLTAELSIELKKPFHELSLKNIIMDVEPEDASLAEQLRSAMNALVILIDRTKKLNESNHSLVEKSLEHVFQMKKNVLGEAIPCSDTYDPQGRKIPHTGGSRLISKEA